MTYFKTEHRKALSMLLVVLLVLSMMAITTLVPVSAAEDTEVTSPEGPSGGNTSPEGPKDEEETDNTSPAGPKPDDDEDDDGPTGGTPPASTDPTDPGEEDPGEEQPGDVPEIEVTAPPVTAETGEDGKASAEVDSAELDKTIEEAIEKAEEEEGAPVVVIPVEVADDATDLEVAIPAASIDKLAEVDNSALKITSRLGDLKLGHTALKALANKVGANDKVVLEISSSLNAVTKVLTTAQNEKIADLAEKYGEEAAAMEVIDVSLLVNDVPMHDFDNGEIEVTIPYTAPAGAAESSIRVYYLSETGKLQRCSGVSYSNGRVTFKTNHLSQYIISAQALLPEFTDVPESEYYYNAVQWAIENGITEGRTETLFMPDDGCTRAQFVTFLWRAYGEPEAAGEASFTDIDVNEYYYKALVWAVSKNITTGTGDGTTFSPDQVCTRAEAVTFMHRAAGEPQAAAASFTDLVQGEYYVAAVNWAVANGITNGNNDAGTTFGPADTCLRCQLVTFLYRQFVPQG